SCIDSANTNVAPVREIAVVSSVTRARPVSRLREPTASVSDLGTKRGSRASHDLVPGGTLRPASMAWSTEYRVRRRVDSQELATSTSTTGMVASSRSDGPPATVGDPTKDRALALDSTGASRVPMPNPRADPTTPSAADSVAKTAPTWPGV